MIAIFILIVHVAGTLASMFQLSDFESVSWYNQERLKRAWILCWMFLAFPFLNLIGAWLLWTELKSNKSFEVEDDEHA